jgi:hypothetical protein
MAIEPNGRSCDPVPQGILAPPAPRSRLANEHARLTREQARMLAWSRPQFYGGPLELLHAGQLGDTEGKRLLLQVL